MPETATISIVAPGSHLTPCTACFLTSEWSNHVSESTTTSTDRLMNTPEVADFLGMKESWVRDNWLSQGIPFYRLGGQLRAKRSELDRWLQGQRAA